MTTIELKLEIVNELGLHARAAAAFVRESSKYTCEIFVGKDGIEVNGKSIMGLMMLAAEKGSFIIVRLEGDDAETASDGITKLVAERFGEER